MEYNISQDCNPNVQTWPFMTKAYILEYFIKWCMDKLGESEINYIKIFHHSEALGILVVNIYNEDQLMHTFLENFQQGGN